LQDKEVQELAAEIVARELGLLPPANEKGKIDVRSVFA
jgi:hypothetical protein